MKKNFSHILSVLFLFISVSCSNDSSTGPEDFDFIAQIIQSVNSDSLTSYVSSLSGATPVSINGQTVTIASRHKNYPGNNMAADYIQQKLEQFGLTVENQNYTSSCRNVFATIEGSTNPDDIYIICAHYDCMPDSPVAPGADDNASGTAAVIEAARILSQYSFEKTVMFALWDEEEQGLVGSRAYAAHARSENMDIKGVINLDMISWERNNDGALKVQENADGSADFICGILLDVDSRYNLSVVPDTVHAIGGSDHRSFAEQGYPAILLIEDYTSDWNANYHTPQDAIVEMNIPYFQDCSKLAIGTLSRLLRITGSN